MNPRSPSALTPANGLQEVTAVRHEIERRTNMLAGSRKGISCRPIFLRIYSPHVSDLSLVDLPGLTMTALTDQGQPADIRDQIQQMLGTYASSERSLVLAVVPARPDLEADASLHFVRQHDPAGARTIGVLTKVDLLNVGADVARYVCADKTPAPLRLQHGYFLCRNRPTAEVRRGLTVEEGHKREATYFAGHAAYAPLRAAGRLGVPALRTSLGEILVEHLRAHLPAVLSEVDAALVGAQQELLELGDGPPATATGRATAVQVSVADLVRDFSAALDESPAQAHHRVGRQIKDHFVTFRQQLAEVDPFDESALSDAEVLEATRDCEGNHLSSLAPNVAVLEMLVTDPDRRPLDSALPPALACADAVHAQLVGLLDSLMASSGGRRFPQLFRELREAAVLPGLQRCREAAREQVARGPCARPFLTVSERLQIRRAVAMEQAYVYSEDPQFVAELRQGNTGQPEPLQARRMRQMLGSYWRAVRRVLQHAVPKVPSEPGPRDPSSFLAAGDHAGAGARRAARAVREGVRHGGRPGRPRPVPAAGGAGGDRAPAGGAAGANPGHAGGQRHALGRDGSVSAPRFDATPARALAAR